MKYQSPFDNDIFAMIWQAFKNLYPDKDCICYWDVPEPPEDEEGHEVFGMTYFEDDGSIVVCVSPTLKICDAAEIFAHELAHVAVGSDQNHNEAWQAAFDAIFAEYNRVGDEAFPDGDKQRVKVIDGKKCVLDEESRT